MRGSQDNRLGIPFYVTYDHRDLIKVHIERVYPDSERFERLSSIPADADLLNLYGEKEPRDGGKRLAEYGPL